MHRSFTPLDPILFVAAVVSAACVGDSMISRSEMEETSSDVRLDLAAPAPERLSDYRFFVGPPADLSPNEDVLPYDLNTPLFSDYSTKYRFIWMPANTTAEYKETGTFELPIGSVVIKTFSYLTDLRDPSKGRRILETRLLVHTEGGWEARIYIWNDQQTEATLDPYGKEVDTEWIHADGSTRTVRYIIPNRNQCASCHENNRVLGLIGPKAGNLNRTWVYVDGEENQLAHMARLGMLSGLPPIDSIPKLPVWDDPSSDSVEERARAWIDVQCAHCHNPVGPARTSGLDLRFEQREPSLFGVCKPPVAAGRGAGTFQFDIVPGKPEESIVPFRIESTDPGIRMPELPIRLVHEEGAALVREWISSLQGSCN